MSGAAKSSADTASSKSPEM